MYPWMTTPRREWSAEAVRLVRVFEDSGDQLYLTPDQARQHARHLDGMAHAAADDHASRRTYTERARQVRAAADEVEK